jgi:hypothetical protein
MSHIREHLSILQLGSGPINSAAKPKMLWAKPNDDHFSQHLYVRLGKTENQEFTQFL